MTMNVWHAKKVKSISHHQIETRNYKTQPLNKRLNLTQDMESQQHLHSDDMDVPYSTHNYSSTLGIPKYNAATHEKLPRVSADVSAAAHENTSQATSQSMLSPKKRYQNISDPLLHAALMRNAIEALEKSSLTLQAAPNVSFVDIKFDIGTTVDSGSVGWLNNSKKLPTTNFHTQKVAADAMDKSDSPTKQESRLQSNKVTSLVKIDQRRDATVAVDSACKDTRIPIEPSCKSDSPGPTKCRNTKQSPTLLPRLSIQSRKEGQSPIMPSSQLETKKLDGTREYHSLMSHDCCVMNTQNCFLISKCKQTGCAIASEGNVAPTEPRSALVESIERNAIERIQICSSIDHMCLKLEKQWQANQNTLLCRSNTRLQGLERSQLLKLLRSLRENQDSFLLLAQSCTECCGTSSLMSRKVTRWKQEMELHMHELVKLPTVADVVNEIAVDGCNKSNRFKPFIGTFSGCAKEDLATAAAQAKLLLGSKTILQQDDSEIFHISGNNVAPTNGQLSSILLSPAEPLEEYNKVNFCENAIKLSCFDFEFTDVVTQRLLNGLPGVFVRASLTEGIAGSRVCADVCTTQTHAKSYNFCADDEKACGKCNCR
jgi:hypothetical protein